jgi:hypothetical protein
VPEHQREIREDERDTLSGRNPRADIQPASGQLPEPAQRSAPAPVSGREIVVRPGYTQSVARTAGSSPPLTAPSTWLADWRTRALLAVTSVLIILFIAVLVIIVSVGHGASAQPEQTTSVSPPVNSPGKSPPPPRASGSPTPAASTANTRAPSRTPATGNAHTVYENKKLSIPPMSGYDVADINLTPTAQVTFDSVTGSGDLVYYPPDSPPWDQSGDPIADLGAQVPSYTVCQQAIETHPMDLSAQNLFQSHGYCLAVNQGEIAYVRIVSLVPGNSNISGPVVLRVTLWQS